MWGLNSCPQDQESHEIYWLNHPGAPSYWLESHYFYKNLFMTFFFFFQILFFLKNI